MPPLDQLTREAAALGAGRTPEQEVERQLQICNACRYCEGFCAVFPAMTRRLEFGPGVVHYLANLCHNCGACLHACQYAPPHEFAVNVPRALAEVRAETYRTHAWPAALGALYRRSGWVTFAVTLLAVALFVALARQGGGLLYAPAGGSFYAVFPHNALALVFGAAFAWAALALTLGARKFWRAESEPYDAALARGAGAETLHNVFALKYLDGGHGDGCNEADDAFTQRRRRLHHLVFYGFVLCFMSTSVATLYHYLLKWDAPYPPDSLPVLLGTVGGVALAMGSAGLLWLNLRRHPLHGDPAQRPLDRSFALLLLGTAVTGIALLLARHTVAMPLLLAVHLGIVLALFLLTPYGKAVHGVYRAAALLKYAIERRQPSKLQLGSE